MIRFVWMIFSNFTSLLWVTSVAEHLTHFQYSLLLTFFVLRYRYPCFKRCSLPFWLVTNSMAVMGFQIIKVNEDSERKSVTNYVWTESVNLFLVQWLLKLLSGGDCRHPIKVLKKLKKIISKLHIAT